MNVNVNVLQTVIHQLKKTKQHTSKALYWALYLVMCKCARVLQTPISQLKKQTSKNMKSFILVIESGVA